MKHCIHGLSVDPNSSNDLCLVCISPTASEPSEIDSLRAEVEALKVIISQWYSVYTDDMQPDGDLLADTDAALRGEGE